MLTSPSKRAHPLLDMQRAVGNREVVRWLRRPESIAETVQNKPPSRMKWIVSLGVAALAGLAAAALWLVRG